MNVTWNKSINDTWYILSDNIINIIPPIAKGVYVIFTNYNNIPLAQYVGKGEIKDRLARYTDNHPMRARRKITGSLCVTWASIPNVNDQSSAEAYLIRNLNPIENRQRPVLNPFFIINLPW